MTEDFDWQDHFLDDRPNYTWGHPPRRRSAWRHWPWVTITVIAIGIGYAAAVKAIPQAVLDCATYCEKEIGE